MGEPMMPNPMNPTVVMIYPLLSVVWSDRIETKSLRTSYLGTALKRKLPHHPDRNEYLIAGPSPQ